MAITQKAYIGDTLIKKQYRGSTEIVNRYGNEFNQLDIDYLIVAGGGSSGADNAGGGGAGGLLSGSSYTLTAGVDYPTVVGNGAAAGDGNNSTFLGFITIGGGAGGGNYDSGSDGGSGGGGAYFDADYPGGSGSLGQGFDGGAGIANTPSATPPSRNEDGAGGGGGGASEVGEDATRTLGIPKAGDGGDGSQWLDGNYYAGGGGGGVTNIGTVLSTGGLGGGGNGGRKPFPIVPGEPDGVPNGEPGAPNTGGGGGGGFLVVAAGGSGIIIVRYQSDVPLSESGDEIYRDGNYWYHKFTSVGSSNFRLF